MKSVYWAARTGSLNKAVCASSLKGKYSFLPSFFIFSNDLGKIQLQWCT